MKSSFHFSVVDVVFVLNCFNCFRKQNQMHYKLEKNTIEKEDVQFSVFVNVEFRC